MALDAVTAPTSAPATARRRRSRGRIALAVVLGLALLLGIGGWYVGAGPGAYVRVPTVVGLTQADATAALTKRGLDAEVSQGFSETVEAGSVMSADPGEGARARKGSAVQLVISRGPERYGVPKLAGLTEDAARAAIASSHLVVGQVSRRFDDSVPDGKVVSASLKPGTKVRSGTAVDLVISRGREPVAVGDWVGKPADQATKALKDSGLKVTTTEAFDDQVPKGSVVSQDPGPGTAFKGDTVKLVVSKGPELVEVPRVVGMSAAKARAKLEAAGFKVKVTAVFGNGGGTVIAQRPERRHARSSPAPPSPSPSCERGAGQPGGRARTAGPRTCRAHVAGGRRAARGRDGGVGQHVRHDQGRRPRPARWSTSSPRASSSPRWRWWSRSGCRCAGCTATRCAVAWCWASSTGWRRSCRPSASRTPRRR